MEAGSKPSNSLSVTVNNLMSEKYRNWLHIYTAGSCIKGCSSASAVCISQYCLTSISKLSLFFDPLFTELHAIMMALELVVKEPDDHLLLISDCLFALANILCSQMNSGCKYLNIILQIKYLIYISHSKKFTFLWIPGHLEIEGNIVADRIARDLTVSNLVPPNYFQDLVKAIALKDYCD